MRTHAVDDEGRAFGPAVGCPSCGARLGDLNGCRAVFDDLSARAWTALPRGSAHNLVVDTYALQHPDEFCRSAKSYAAHLTGLCFAMEGHGRLDQYWSIPRWLDGPGTLERPRDVKFRGSITIENIRSLGDEEYVARVRGWAADVWAAYSVHQALARQWLATAMDASRQRT